MKNTTEKEMLFEKAESAFFIKADPLVLVYYTKVLELRTIKVGRNEYWKLVDLIELKSFVYQIKKCAFYDGSNNEQDVLFRRYK